MRLTDDGFEMELFEMEQGTSSKIFGSVSALNLPPGDSEALLSLPLSGETEVLLRPRLST